jgi:hypothetical protein
MGDDNGSLQICEEHGIQYVPDIEKNEYNTPVFSDMVKKADSLAIYPYILHLSSDIIIFQDVVKALQSIKNTFQSFCAVCRKWDTDLDELLRFDDPSWIETAKANGDPSMITSGDFYLYTKGFWDDLPPFVVGRSYCDSYLFHQASERKLMINLSPAVTIMHQKHDYKHVPEGNPEFNVNQRLCQNKIKNISHANYVMNPDFSITENL